MIHHHLFPLAMEAPIRPVWYSVATSEARFLRGCYTVCLSDKHEKARSMAGLLGVTLVW